MIDGELATGTVIDGRYEVEAILGRGGFGTTYRARERASGRPVAIKRLDLRGLREWKGLELFEREAAVLRRLDHPRIPAYVDFVPVEADRAGLLVQALAPGRSLAAALAERGRFSAAEVAAIADQILEILIYLGDLAPPVVHRDLKPDNLVIDDQGGVRLVDFGAVKDALARATAVGSTVAGTFGYMAPELLSGVGDPRADLFALGMTMIHLLTGLAPVELPQRRLRPDYRGRVDADERLLAVIDRLTEPVPEDRYEDAARARRALADAVASVPARRAPAADLAAIVEAQRRAHQAAAAAATSASERARLRRIDRYERRPSRVVVTRGPSGLRVLIRPAHLWDALEESVIEVTIVPIVFAVLAGLVAILAFGLGIVGVILVGLGVYGLAFVWVALGRRRWVIDVAPSGHFAIYARTPRRADLVGLVGDLLAVSGAPSDDRLNTLQLGRRGGTYVEIEHLTARDVGRVCEALGLTPE